jgi:hypothetical protein
MSSHLNISGGIGGNIVGTYAAEFMRGKIKNANFFTSALFTLPCIICMIIAVNTTSLAMAIAFTLFAEIFLFTSFAPITTIQLSVIPPQLRSRGAALSIFFDHIFGDMISPPLIGAISDGTSSLRLGLQCTWMAVCVSGAWWWFGYAYLTACDPKRNTMTSSRMDDSSSPGVHNNASDDDMLLEDSKLTYCDVLFGKDPLIMDADGCVTLR